MNRVEFLEIVRNEELKSKASLEVGALDKPLLTGNSARYLDVFTSDQLREHYKNDPNVNIDNIVDVSYLGFDQVMDASLDLFFSSHNVEHIPDLVSHFKILERILNIGGQVFFCVPDHRHCFDHYKNVSSIADVLAAYIEKRERPSPLNILEHFLFSSENKLYWDGYEDPNYSNRPNVAKLMQICQVAMDHINYIDSHCWKFTPDSFQYILESLIGMGLISFVICNIYPTQQNSNEFFVHLRKS